MLSFPNAKINIGLSVVGQRPDGYHNIETVFYPIPLQDVLDFKVLSGSNDPYLLQVVGNTIEGASDKNLVVEVYNSLKEDFKLPPLDIYLCKKIPIGAGLGGGSSDAAYMMKALNEAFDLQLSIGEMEQRIAEFGADCAFFIKEEPAFATGIGDKLSPIKLSLKGMALILVKPEISVSTKEAYAHITPKRPACDLRQALQQPIKAWKDTVKNDFEDSVFPQYPEIEAIKQTLYDMGALYASMSGSGSAVFGLFDHLHEEVQSVFADCYVFQQMLRL